MSSLETVRFKQLLCSICLDLFTNPVTSPCGHNFCKSCITQAWKTIAPCRCPLCNEVYNIIPVLKVNTLLSELVSDYKQERNIISKQKPRPEVLCDMCTDPKLKAVKSCLVCLASFCETHLQPHLSVSGLQRHQLMEPVDDLGDRTCPKHNKPLELFCRTDKTCVCAMCPLLEHKNHEMVSLKEEFDRGKSSLRHTQTLTKRMMEQRDKKKQEFRRALELSQKTAETEEARGLQAFTALEQSLQRGKEQFIQELQEKHQQTQKQAQVLISELDQEICELEKRGSEVEQLSRSEDHFYFLQNYTSLRPTAGLRDWSTVSFEPCKIFKGTATRALAELEQTVSGEFRKAFGTDVKRLQQFAVDVTLDPDTAHPKIVLSKDHKEVYGGDVWNYLPDYPQRFDQCVCVLGKQTFSSGRFYFEVQVEGKTKWTLGLTKESSSKKGKISVFPEKGYWCIWLRNSNEYRACTDPPIRLSPVRPPQKVGVFVDYSEGVVSFYDVDSGDLLYSFTSCRFTEKIFPFFDPCNNERGVNSAPMVVTKI